MQLTKGQKDAIARKAEAIVNEKRAALQEKYKKEWKPSKEVNVLIKTINKVNQARLAYIKAVEDAGFEYYYSGVNIPLKSVGLNDAKVNFEHNTSKDVVENTLNKIIELQCNQKYNENGGQKFPILFDIMDDIELLNLSKQFDMDKFLEKYRNL